MMTMTTTTTGRRETTTWSQEETTAHAAKRNTPKAAPRERRNSFISSSFIHENPVSPSVAVFIAVPPRSFCPEPGRARSKICSKRPASSFLRGRRRVCFFCRFSRHWFCLLLCPRFSFSDLSHSELRITLYLSKRFFLNGLFVFRREILASVPDFLFLPSSLGGFFFFLLLLPKHFSGTFPEAGGQKVWVGHTGQGDN